jgi:hypothetical protein
MTTASIERVAHYGPNAEMAKRTYLPFIIRSACPHCGREVVTDLRDEYLRYPVPGKTSHVYFECEGDEDTQPHELVEWTVYLEFDVTLKPVEQSPDE